MGVVKRYTKFVVYCVLVEPLHPLGVDEGEQFEHGEVH